MRNQRYPALPAAMLLCTAGVIATAAGNSALAQSAAFDGTYAGSQTLTDKGPGGNYSQCLRGPFKRKLIVKDGAVTYTYNPTYHGEVAGTVNPGGDVTAYISTPEGGVRLAGHIDGDAFTGEVWSVICTYALELKRVP